MLLLLLRGDCVFIPVAFVFTDRRDATRRDATPRSSVPTTDADGAAPGQVGGPLSAPFCREAVTSATVPERDFPATPLEARN